MTDRETRTALPSTPAAVRRGWVKPVPRRSRLEYVIWGTAILFGSTIGGTLALRAEPSRTTGAAVQLAANPAGTAPASPAGTAAANPGGGTATANPGGGSATANPGGGTATANPGGSTATANPGGAAAAAPSGAATVETADRAARAAAIGQINDALRRFVRWSRSHAGARCPDAAAIGAQPDPWGHALRITCTDQPADQIAGVVSAGPDGIAGTRDDIESWTLGDAATDVVRGPRWHAGRPGSRPPASITQPKIPPASPGAGSSDKDGDGIPDRR